MFSQSFYSHLFYDVGQLENALWIEFGMPQVVTEIGSKVEGLIAPTSIMHSWLLLLS